MVLSSEEKPPGRRGRVGLGVLVVVALAVAGTAYWHLAREAPGPAPTPEIPAPRSTPAPPLPAEAPAPAAAGNGVLEISGGEDGATVLVDGREIGALPRRVELKAGSHRIRVEKEGFQPFVREVHIVPGRTLEIEARLDVVPPQLSVDADVPGAQVFLDRRFVGRTPLLIREVEPGEHRLNVSAEGYEGFRKDITVGSGRNEVQVRFKEVRLDESLAVKHKHGIGSCQGRLVASPTGLRYEADHDKDGFDAPFSSLEPLEVDYLGKNLRVKVRGGRTYNFTAEDADLLLAFQQAVEATRQRLP